MLKALPSFFGYKFLLFFLHTVFTDVFFQKKNKITNSGVEGEARKFKILQTDLLSFFIRFFQKKNKC